jgi:FkbM family methyltransferase
VVATQFNSKKSKSDFKEDLLIEQIAKNDTFSYVDIGAGHPIIGSNSFYFYKKGYSGLTIEPIKFHSYLHKLFRHRDQHVNGLVSNQKTPMKFYEFNPTQYSTNSEEHFKHLLSLGMKPRKIYYVFSVNINELLRLKQYQNYFISIDCEGFDYDILKLLDFKLYKKPFAIVLEAQQDEDLRNKISLLLSNHGFNLRFVTKNNLIYTNS